MIRTLLFLQGGLMRGALAYVLSTQEDIDVVGELADLDSVEAAMRAQQPDVTVFDLNPLGVEGVGQACAAHQRLGRCRILALAGPRQAPVLATMIGRHGTDIGVLGNDASPQRVIDGVRRLYRGEPVLDGNLVVAALGATSPLTARERDVLRTVADGSPVNEIASKLGLTPGTVRNHLSRIIAKTGARNRIQAVRTARESGWI